MRTSPQKSRYFITFLLALLVLCLSACSKKAEEQPKAPAARPIKLMTIGETVSSSSNGSTQTRKLPGTVKATDQVDLAFQVAGTLIDLPIKEGQRIKKGDLVAKLDTRDFISNLNNAKGVVAKANASVEYANAEYQRYRNIKATDAGAVSDSIVSLKQTSLRVSKADLQSAQAGLAIAQDQLDYTSLRAPFSGIVARKYVDNFQELKAKQAVVSIQNISDIDITVDVPEMMMTPIRKTKPQFFAEFAADSSRRFELKLNVVLSMPAPTGIRILSGMTATVSIEFAEANVNTVVMSETNIIIPLIAVLADNTNKSTVWVVDEKTMSVHRREVKTGDLSGADSIRISSGLKEGEVIAISGVSKLQEGQVVRKFE
ncbi:MAG: efflux RND transporter periplasmic adaptor subunit [Methylococcaceae bacterium]|nr:efflux RND transporter periplasmic adaptor subunit [Methylococcaceae bacterium]